MKKYQYILTYNSTNYTLTHNPAGWKDLSITYLRNEFYHSVLRSFTLSLRFPNVTGGGYSVIKAAYDAEGIYASVSVQIKVRNPNTNAYDALFTGVIDFNPDKFSIEKDYIEASIIDSSKLQKFISRDTNEINLFATKSIDDVTIVAPTKKTIQFTPIDIVLKNMLSYEVIHNYLYGSSYQYYNPTYIVDESNNLVLDSTSPGNKSIISNDGEINLNITLTWIRTFNITVTAAPPYTATPYINFDWYIDVYDGSNNRTSRETIPFPTEFTHEEIESMHYYKFTGSNIEVKYSKVIVPGGRVELFIANHHPEYINIYYRNETGTISATEIS